MMRLTWYIITWFFIYCFFFHLHLNDMRARLMSMKAIAFFSTFSLKRESLCFTEKKFLNPDMVSLAKFTCLLMFFSSVKTLSLTYEYGVGIALGGVHTFTATFLIIASMPLLLITKR